MNKDHHEVRVLREDLDGIWPHPDIMDSWAFLVTEVAEVGDALLRMGYGSKTYTRNTWKEPDLSGELADVYLMLLTLVNHFGYDLSTLLQAKIRQFRRKHEIEEE